MKIKYTKLFRQQENVLTEYLFREFGINVALKITSKIKQTIQNIPPFISKYPLYLTYRGYEVHRIVNKKNYIFYTVSGDTLWTLAIFDTRMSPKTMRKIVTQQITTL